MDQSRPRGQGSWFDKVFKGRTKESQPTRGRLAFEGEAFHLHLDGDWLQAPSEDPERFAFVSNEKLTTVIISVMRVNLPRARLLEAAERLADARRAAEQAVPGRTVTFGESWTELKENGELGHIAYAGYDNHGSIFRFMGWATQAKLLSFWVATQTADNETSKRVFNEVFAGFRFYVP